MDVSGVPGPEQWSRVKKRLRAELGEDVFSSWFARVDLESRGGRRNRLFVGAHPFPEAVDPVALSRPAHQSVAERVWRHQSHRADRTRRNPGAAFRRCPGRQSGRRGHRRIAQVLGWRGSRNGGAGHDACPSGDGQRVPSGRVVRPVRCRGAGRRGARSEVHLLHLRGRPLECACARGCPPDRRQRPGHLQSALSSRQRRPRQDAPSARDCRGSAQWRAQGAVPDRRALHVPLRGGAEVAVGARLQGHAARHRPSAHRRHAVPARQADPAGSSATR